ncbi:MAG: two-component regulator propeller domain-containing protein [Salinivirgaceae bacterium]
MRFLVFIVCLSGLFLANNYLHAIDTEFAFRHLTLDEGLSNSNVNCIVQDSNGFIWIGTENGLNKYDGYKFTHYYSDPNQKNSLYSNEILTMLVDSEGDLWIGTFQGLFRYNQNYDNFIHLPVDSINLLNANIPVYAIVEDSDGILWIGTSGNGLIRYHKQKGILKTYFHDALNPFSLSSNYIFTVFIDSKNKLWIGTTDNGLEYFDRSTQQFYNYKPIKTPKSQQNVNAILKIFELNDTTFLLGTRGDGLFLFHTHKKTFTPYLFKTSAKETIRVNEIYGIYRDSNQRLWVSSHGKGLFYFENQNIYLHLEHEPGEKGSLLNNNVRTIFEDRQGNLWFVSYQGGINILPKVHKRFVSFNLSDAGAEYTSNIVTSMVSDQAGNVWVGTDGGGLKYVDRQNKSVSHFYPGSNVSDFIPDRVVMSLMLEDEKNLWIGSYLGGLSVFDLETRKFKNYKNNENPDALSCNFVSCILKSTKGEVWIATNGGGLNKYVKETDSFKSYSMYDTTDENRLINNYVNTLTEDNNGRIWIGTFWGLSVFDPQNGLFINYLGSENLPGSLSNNTIYSIKITSKNEIWLGTRNGLNKFMPSSNKFQSFNLSEGLPGNVVYSIEEDEKGNLWLTTNNGLCNFNPNTFETHNYYESDGLLSNEFFRLATHQSVDGEIFLGSLKGMVSFKPDAIEENYPIPKAMITQFKIFDQEIKPGIRIKNDAILNKPVFLSDTIVLKHKYNSFAFEFAALDFTLPEKNRYRCMMEGFDQDWRNMSYDQRFVTYTNLDAGTYTFKVKASSIDHEWDQRTTNITLIIKPPLYRTWWAYSLYYLFLVGIIALFWWMSINRVKLKNQVKLELLEKDKENELTQAKLRFFTNISHEFRTPITLIIGPMERMLSDASINKKYGKSLTMMFKNANRLLRLVNQLMDLRKSEGGNMRLRVERLDLIKFVEDIHYNFKEFAQQKKIHFQLFTDVPELFMWFDPDKLDKILFNLLSNAFKFSAQNGEVSIFICIEDKKQGPFVRIGVEDHGKGIPEKDKERIFERFFQTSNSGPFDTAGSGVGLSLTRSLVELHHGEINFESTEHKGTLFNVLLPLDETVYSDEEKSAADQNGSAAFIHNLPLISGEDLTKDEPQPDEITSREYSILIVEDNYDLRNYIADELSDHYQVFKAENGREGLKKAIAEMPDLIIADVMMPEMDGLELCAKIKTNLVTNHIPVILLTARTSIEQRIEGIEHGADSYIPKPFHPSHLRARIKKLIELREVLKYKFSAHFESKDSPSLEVEDLFLKKITDMIMKNIDDSELNIESLSRDIGISRGHLYRKIKLLTGKSPSEFVRLVRLNEAARLLVQNNKSVSEVSYQVGFNSPSYFTICFKEHFEVSPSEFAERSKLNRK